MKLFDIKQLSFTVYEDCDMEIEWIQNPFCFMCEAVLMILIFFFTSYVMLGLEKKQKNWI